ncbi:RHS domain-containing protein [Streptococcus xiaochunlingii]|uniref:RHS domain-containing protein n=1 Tax=Streptococcus xiaochunlingii TaxID=2589788 RepID=UPI002555B586|nr:RHS domain-containing protein [Streptococcus xiaochunlingii]MDK8386334.1 RHS domain-containing protein [Streptococcus xiaochunlingii]MDK8777528.1 RHS domain-containing protein [Streptococcus xiaochunlingii]
MQLAIAHYFHYDQIGILREITDIHGNLLWYGEYTTWGCLKYFFPNNLSQNRLRIRPRQSYSKNTRT